MKDLRNQIIELQIQLEKVKEKNIELEDQVKQLREQSLDQVKNAHNIVLIGKTGKGKSTLANVLTGTSNFQESDSAISETKEINTAKNLNTKELIIE